MPLPNPALLGAIYGLSEIALGLTRRSGGETRRRDRHSLALLWIVIAMSLIASWSIVFQSATLPHRRFFYFLGLFLFVGGVVLRWYAIVRLGRFFTVDVSIAEQHRVVDTGPYRFIRHPSYTGALLAFLGFGFCLGNYMSILWVMVPVTAAFLWRIHVEERALLEALGDDYRRYMHRTRRLVPFLY